MIAIMSTGDELVDIREGQSKVDSSTAKERWTGVWDTNRPSLQAVLESMGYEVMDLGIVGDTYVFSICWRASLRPYSRPDAHMKTLTNGLSYADIILTTGGTSMGASDLLKVTLSVSDGTGV